MKLNKNTTTIIFLLLCYFAVAQNKKNDSLWAVYNSKTQPDTNRLKAINTIAWSYSRNNPDTAIILAEQELKLANTIHSEKGKRWAAKAFSTIGASFINKSNYPYALEYFLKALKLFEETNNKKGSGSV